MPLIWREEKTDNSDHAQKLQQDELCTKSLQMDQIICRVILATKGEQSPAFMFFISSTSACTYRKAEAAIKH